MQNLWNSSQWRLSSSVFFLVATAIAIIAIVPWMLKGSLQRTAGVTKRARSMWRTLKQSTFAQVIICGDTLFCSLLALWTVLLLVSCSPSSIRQGDIPPSLMQRCPPIPRLDGPVTPYVLELHRRYKICADRVDGWIDTRKK